MPETRNFGLGAVLSVTTGIMLCDIGEIYEILGWMTGEGLMTHQLPRALRECEDNLRAQFPQLADAVVPKLVGKDNYLIWLAQEAEIYGATFDVSPLPADDHTSIDPMAEIAMMRSDATVLALGLDSETGEETP